jgi:hypothetical protein
MEEEVRVAALKLIVGLEDDLFDDVNTAVRVFALNTHPYFAENCRIVRERSPSLALVSPAFIGSVLKDWPAGAEPLCAKDHANALASSLRRHATVVQKLYDSSDTLVGNGRCWGNSTSTKTLLNRWAHQSAQCFEELTFHAICLRFSLLLTSDCELRDDLLGNICSWTAALNAVDSVPFLVRQGPLHLTTAVANFPSLFMDMFAVGDAAEQKLKYNYERAKIKPVTGRSKAMNTLVNALYPKPNEVKPVSAKNAVQSSLATIMTLLAKHEHFCFRPSNPNNQGEDGVIFLANEDSDFEWVVVLLQNKRWWHEGAVEEWRGTTEDLPPTMLDMEMKTHKLRYVRMLVTANTPTTKEFDETKPAPVNTQHRALNAAYAAAVGQGSPSLTAVSKAAEEWSQNWCAANYPPSSNAAGVRDYLSVKDRVEFLEERYFGIQSQHAGGEKAAVWECATDIAVINRWCPTVGLYMNNVAHLHNIGAVALQSVL